MICKAFERNNAVPNETQTKPEDFQVEEVTEPNLASPALCLYKLVKEAGPRRTPAADRRRWRLNPRQISYGGLKDRHALTTSI